jgi:hypothetical protein
VRARVKHLYIDLYGINVYYVKCSRVGMYLSDESEEAYAYLLQYIFSNTKRLVR